MQRRVRAAQAGALTVQQPVVADAAVVHVARSQAREPQRVTVLHWIDDAHRAAQPCPAGIAITVIVHRRVAGQRRCGVRPHLQVRGAGRLARLQCRDDGDARDIGQQQQRVIERRVADCLPALQRSKRRLQQGIDDAAAIVESDLAVARFDDYEAHHAVLHGLGRDDRAIQRVAVAVVVIADSAGESAQLGEREAFAFRLCNQGVQGRGIECGIARQLNGLDQKERTRRQCATAWLFDGESRSAGRGRGRHDRLRLLQDRTRTGYDWLGSVNGQRRKKHSQRRRQRLSGAQSLSVHSRRPRRPAASPRRIRSAGTGPSR